MVSANAVCTIHGTHGPISLLPSWLVNLEEKTPLHTLYPKHEHEENHCLITNPSSFPHLSQRHSELCRCEVAVSRVPSVKLKARRPTAARFSEDNNDTRHLPG